jgi:ABC-type glycerol-3-phosphate transport system substrate-binding protein
MDFMAWVLSTPENLSLFTNIMPSTPAATELTLLGEFYDPFKEVLASPNTKHPIALNPGLPEQAEVLRNVTQSAFLGDMTAEEAAQSFCEQIAGTLYEQ